MPGKHTVKRRPAIEKTCPECCTVFKTWPSVNSTFCSRICRWTHARKAQPVNICERCGVGYTPTQKPTKSGRGRRYCSRVCYQDAYRRGGMSAEAYFWTHVTKTESCWLWTGATSRGYGSYWGGGRMLAHRYAWIATNGEIPAGLFVLHNCPDGDNPLCVRPDHLFLGTQAANMRDMTMKGRSPVARLTPEHVHEIREWLAAGMGPTKIARAYNVTRAAINSIKKGRSWSQD